MSTQKEVNDLTLHHNNNMHVLGDLIDLYLSTYKGICHTQNDILKRTRSILEGNNKPGFHNNACGYNTMCGINKFQDEENYLKNVKKCMDRINSNDTILNKDDIYDYLSNILAVYTDLNSYMVNINENSSKEDVKDNLVEMKRLCQSFDYITIEEDVQPTFCCCWFCCCKAGKCC